MPTEQNEIKDVKTLKTSTSVVKEVVPGDAKKQKTKSIINVVAGSVIYMLAIAWVFQLGGFFAGGVTGSVQLIVAIINKFVHFDAINDYFSLIFIIANIPLLIIGYKSMSKNFAMLTILSIVIQTVVSAIVSNFTVSPFAFLLENNGMGLFDMFTSGTFSMVKNPENLAAVETFKETMTPGTRLLLAFFGGLLTGVGGALCLKEGGSAGGTDIISNYVMFKHHKSFVKYQFTIDIIIIAISSILSVENVLYTIVCLITKIKTIDLIYKTYKTVRLEIITQKPEELRDQIFKNFSHSMTIYEVTGGYTMQKKNVIEIFVSSYEVRLYRRLILKVDPAAFIISSQVKLEKGNYVQKTIV